MKVVQNRTSQRILSMKTQFSTVKLLHPAHKAQFAHKPKNHGMHGVQITTLWNVRESVREIDDTHSEGTVCAPVQASTDVHTTQACADAHDHLHAYNRDYGRPFIPPRNILPRRMIFPMRSRFLSQKPLTLRF